MSNFVERIVKIVGYAENEKSVLLQEIADLKEKLSVVIADDAADHATIVAAQEEAAAAKVAAETAAAKVVELQTLVDADVAEDAAIDELLTSLEAAIPQEQPAPEPVVEPAPEPVVEPAPEEIV